MSIADCLFPPSVQNILRVVYAAPAQSFMLKELIAHARSGRGNAQRHIDALLEYGVLKEEARNGHQRTISANTSFALYPELFNIYRKTFGLVEPIREALAPLKNEIDEAFVFGSVAKDRDHHQSDIDLMVIGSAPLVSVMEALLKAEQILGRAIHLNMYGASEWATIKDQDPVLARIASDTIVRILPDAQAT